MFNLHQEPTGFRLVESELGYLGFAVGDPAGSVAVFARTFGRDDAGSDGVATADAVAAFADRLGVYSPSPPGGSMTAKRLDLAAGGIHLTAERPRWPLIISVSRGTQAQFNFDLSLFPHEAIELAGYLSAVAHAATV